MDSGNRKCVTDATNPLIQEAATIVENLGWNEASAVIGDSHILEAKVFQRERLGVKWHRRVGEATTRAPLMPIGKD
jgi:hypothetical protein|eukprot:COSAG03_NODE_1380_length_4206_cov_8.952764_2_plen_76_part_00